MLPRRAAFVLLALMALCLACEFVFDEDHGADFASEIGSWGASASPREQSLAVLAAPSDLALHICRPALQRGEAHQSADAVIAVTPPLRSIPTGLSPPSAC